jgi:mannose-6-phosphate isomerase-like protein (cupin superfamily)
MKIRRQQELVETPWAGMFGGVGTAANVSFWDADELQVPVRFCGRTDLPAGTSVGDHRHEGEQEILVILAGAGRILGDDGVAVAVAAGDTVLTGPDEGHRIEAGKDGLSMLAFIVRRG